MQAQVLAAMIPIQQINAVMSFLAQRLPIERIFSLSLPVEPAPVLLSEQMLAKRRGPPTWTVDSLLSAQAIAENYIAPMAGRPDTTKAGAEILKMLHSGALSWAFRPIGDCVWPEHDGIWLSAFTPTATYSRSEDVTEEVESGSEYTSEEDLELNDEEEVDSSQPVTVRKGPFAALSEEEEEEDEDSEEVSADEAR